MRVKRRGSRHRGPRNNGADTGAVGEDTHRSLGAKRRGGGGGGGGGGGMNI